MSDHFNLNSKLENQIQILNTLANKTIIYNRLQPGDIPVLGVALKINQSTYSKWSPATQGNGWKILEPTSQCHFKVWLFFGLPRAAWTFATKSTGDSIVFFCGVFVNNSVYVRFTLWAAFVTITRCIGISLNPTQDIPVKLCFDKLKHKHLTQQRWKKWMLPWLKEARLFTADPGKAEQTAKQWEDMYKLAAKKFCQGNQHISYFFSFRRMLYMQMMQ